MDNDEFNVAMMNYLQQIQRKRQLHITSVMVIRGMFTRRRIPPWPLVRHR